MDLFNSDPISNILSNDGEVNYYGKILNNENAQYYFDQWLQNIQWDNDKAIIFGKLIVTKRKVAWYGDKPFDYTYSKTTKSGVFKKVCQHFFKYSRTSSEHKKYERTIRYKTNSGLSATLNRYFVRKSCI